MRNQGREYRLGFIAAPGAEERTPDQRPHRALPIRVQPIQQHACQPFAYLVFYPKGLRKVPGIKLGENKGPPEDWPKDS